MVTGAKTKRSTSSTARIAKATLGSLTLLLFTALISSPALALNAAGAQGNLSAEQPARSDPRSVTILSLPLLREEDVLGEIEVEIDAAGAARFERFTLLRTLGPILSDEGRAKLSEDLVDTDYISARALSELGIEMRFDMSRLEVVIGRLDTNLLPVVDLESRNRRLEDREPTIQPSGFSTFLNVAGNFEYVDNDGFGTSTPDPDIIAFGATRIGDFALQYEGGLTSLDDGEYGPYRRFVRGIYDIENRYMRISAGEVQTMSLPLLGTQLIGGVGVERRRRIFDPFEPVFQLGGRRLRINSPSTIEIINNGNLVSTIPVEQGIYDLDQLPLAFGANDVQVVIRDAAGRTTTTDFNYFFDPVDLEVGDYEFGAFAGFVSDLTGLQPSYGGKVGASAFYRRAISPSLLLGGAFQLSEDVQAAAAEIRLVPQIFPGVIETQLAMSNGDNGIGFATRTGYRWSQAIPQGSRQISILFDYESNGFELPGQPDLFRQERLSINATYGQSLSPSTFLNAGISQIIRDTNPGQTTAFADIVHQFTDRLRATGGVQYGRNDGFDTEWGVRVGITFLFDRNSRVNADAQTRRSLYRVGANRGAENRVGAWGYDVGIERNSGSTLADASLQYRGNRFDARLLAQTSGDGFGSVTDNRRAQLQLSTAFAYADGAFGIGRSITDGFALVQPVDGIGGEAIVGNNLNEGEYLGRSGTFGAAVVPDILGYQTREIVYDIDADGTVFDVGDGNDRVRVATGGGTKILIGNTRFVSAVGTLMIDQEPGVLLVGEVTSRDDEGFEPLAFYTNSAGRFSILGLAPDKIYLITLRDGREFAITVPDTDQGLLRLGTVTLERSEE